MTPDIPRSRIRRTARIGGLAAGQGARWAGTRAGNLVRGDERRRRASDARMIAMAEALVDRLGEMKGAAMKLGQVLSTVDLVALPDDERDRFKAKLAELQAQAPPMEWKHVRKVIQEDLGGRVADHFADFEQEAFAAASIGQVHRAVDAEGRAVAVKVQYPGVAEAVAADLRNLGLFVPLVRKLAPGVDAEALVAEVRERVSEELDYELEAQNQRRVWRAFRGHPFVVVPRVDTALSTRRVLVSEYVDGASFGEIRRLDEQIRDRFGEVLFRFFFATLTQMQLALGDPHPGNYLWCGGGRVCFLDFGLVRRIAADHLAGERRLAEAIIAGDAGAVHHSMAELGYLPQPDAFEPERLLEQVGTAAGWLFEPGFRRLSPDYVRKTIEASSSPQSAYFDQMRRQTLPPASLLMRRMEALLLSVLGDLRAGADWGAIAREYVLGAAPSTPLGEADREFWGPAPALA
jgi:predicted unusual protein kinase regulating ubiquinone biosynthesis (AarF/ABC1/UbiB family)